MASILIIDDDREFCETLADYLKSKNHDVIAVHTGEAGVDFLATKGGPEVSLALLDIGLPGLDGFEVLQRIRTFSAVPVIVLSASDSDENRLLGLELGADDYVAKRTNPRELAARVNVILRRATAAIAGSALENAITINDVCLDLAKRTLVVAGQPVRLTGVEFDILKTLMHLAGQVVSRSDLSLYVMGRRLGPYDRNVDVHVSRLRRKLGPSPSGRYRIEGVRGKGYVFLSKT